MSGNRQHAWMTRDPVSDSPGSLGSEEAGADAFRQAMRRLSGAVCVVTTRHDGVSFGLTATAVCSLTAEPPRILVCINLSGVSYDLIANSRVMAVNVLRPCHRELATSFARKSGEDLFSGRSWTAGATGAPILGDSLVSFDCEVEQMIVTTTHAIVIGEIRYLSYASSPTDSALLYAGGEFQTSTALAPVLD